MRVSRNFIYIYERIYKGENAILAECRNKLLIDGKRTTQTTVKGIKDIILNQSYRIAQECNILVSYPKWHIEGKALVLGPASIWLPDGRIISIEQLKAIEHGKDGRMLHG